MTKFSMHELQDIVEIASAGVNKEDAMLQLNRAFSLFSEETKRLEGAYDKLQKHFKALSIQLEESHQKLQEKVIELDMVSHYLNSILRNMSQGILFVGLNGIITTYNSAAEKILGLNHKTVIFQSYWDLFSDDCFGFSMRQTLNKFSSPQTLMISYRNQELEISTSFVRKKLTSHQGITLLIRDITEIRRLQKEASRKDRLQKMGELASSLAQEIQNPLTMIIDSASILSQELSKSNTLMPLTSQILKGAKKLDHLVEEVLHYTKPLELNKKNCSLLPFLEALKNQIENTSNLPKTVQLRFVFPESLHEAIFDEQLIYTALLKLIHHRIQAIQGKGTLTICARQNRDKLLISINDTGDKLTLEQLDQLFTPHFTSEINHHSLELAEAYKIIEAHQGTIEASSNLDEGTTLFMILPTRGIPNAKGARNEH